MAANGPVFIDQFGASPTQNQPPEPWWKQGWLGQMELWRAYWVCFVFGHGVVIGLGSGFVILTMLGGFMFDTGTLSAGFIGLVISATVMASAYTAFAVWAIVGVWRCADNCVDKRWGVWARVSTVGYGAVVAAMGAAVLLG